MAGAPLERSGVPGGVSLVRRAALLDTAKSDTWFVQGLIHLARQQPDSAVRAFERARRLGIGFDVRAYTSVALRSLGWVPAADTLYAEVRRAYLGM